MQIHQIKRVHLNRKSKIVGRGGRRGTTAGRGTKGQRARAGHKIRPEIRDAIRKIPKKRGHTIHGGSRAKSLYAPINLKTINKYFNDGDIIAPETLLKKKLVKKYLPVKVLGESKLGKKVTFKDVSFSNKAKANI